MYACIREGVGKWAGDQPKGMPPKASRLAGDQLAGLLEAGDQHACEGVGKRAGWAGLWAGWRLIEAS